MLVAMSVWLLRTFGGGRFVEWYWIRAPWWIHHGSMAPVGWWQWNRTRSHPPTEGRWNTLPKSRRTLFCTRPSIRIKISCFVSSGTCCSGSRISFCSCIFNGFVGIDGSWATTASMLGMAWESAKEIVRNRNSALLRRGACREKKSFQQATVQPRIVCRVTGRLRSCLRPLGH